MSLPNVLRNTRALLLLATLLAVEWPASSLAQTYILQPESRLQIEGTSTVNAFTCRAAEVDGQGTLKTTAQTTRSGGAPAVILVPAGRLDCGNGQMNRDLYDALKAEAHPRIQFRLTRTEVLSAPQDGGDTYRIRAEGLLTLAGTERPIEVVVEGHRLPDGRLQGQGAKELLMTDFGIEPPTALLGLVKARDRITVRFHLVAAEARR